MLAWLRRRLALERFAEPAALGRFLVAEAAFVAQKTLIEHVQAHAGRHWPALREDAGFRAALDGARWPAFALALEDLAELADRALRLATDAPSLAPCLPGLLGPALAELPVPEALGPDWRDRVAAAAAARVARARLAPARALTVVPEATAANLIPLIPLPAAFVRHDRPDLARTLAARLVGAHDRLTARADLPRLAAALGA